MPRFDREDEEERVAEKIARYLPWALDEGWTIEYWGLRPARSATPPLGLRVRGPRLPRLRPAGALPLAWAIHFCLALTDRRSTVVLAPVPLSGVGAALASRLLGGRVLLVTQIMGRSASAAVHVRRSRLRGWLIERLERVTLRGADLVFVVGGFTAGLARSAGVPEARILEVPPPTSFGGYRMNGDTDPGDRDPQLIICAARLVPDKGVDLLLRGFALCAAEFPAARLTVAGDGPERAPLERLASELGIVERVAFAGWVPGEEMPALWRSAAIAVLPSRVEEGYPLALVEPSLAGCALIGSDHGGILDIVRPGRNGLLFPPGDSEALAARLKRCLSDPRFTSRLGAAARADIGEHSQRRDRANAELRRRLLRLARAPATAGVGGRGEG